MKTLLLVAHGSRRAASNEEVQIITRRLAVQAIGRYDLVDCAFLEIASPLIPEAIQDLIDRGATQVVVLPYFLSAGRHVAEDIPKEVEGVKQANPGVDIRIVPHLGSAEGMTGLLLGLAGD